MSSGGIQYLSREEYNAQQTAPRVACVGAVSILNPGTVNVSQEQTFDLQLQKRGRKPQNYNLTIPPDPQADKARICLKETKKMREETPQ